MKLYICFDAHKPSPGCVSDNDVILLWSEKNNPGSMAGAVVFEAINFNANLSCGPLAAAVRDFFDEHRNPIIKQLTPFANNFYDCSIMPLYKYFSAMSHILETYQIDEIVFERPIAFASACPNYYLAEHESHSVRLYNRASSMQPCLEAAAASKGIPVKYTRKSRLFSLQKIANKFRLMLVFMIKFCLDLQRVFKSRTRVFKQSSRVKYIFNIRNYNQFQFVCHLLALNKPWLIAAYQGFFAAGLYKSIASNFSSYKEHICFYANTSFVDLFRVYYRNMVNLLTLSNTVFQFNDFTVNVTQSLKECLVMNAEIMLYSQSLNNFLENTDKDNQAIFFSTEQKSPQAWVDAKIAQSHGYRVVHLMQCDQSTLPIPHPVPGDLYVTDSRLRFEAFLRENELFTDKFAFVGSIKGIPLEAASQCGLSGPKATFCFFANIDDTDLNRQVLERLFRLDPQAHFIVKLHPRDSGSWLKKSEKVTVYREGDISRQALFSLFRVAISFPSGVITDLIGMAKPVVILDIKKLQINYQYLHPSYQYYIRHIDALDICLNDIAAIEKEFARVMVLHETKASLTAVEIIEAIESKLLKEEVCAG